MTDDKPDLSFEARRQEAIANMPAQPSAELLAQARHDIANLFENAVDWLSFNQADPKFEKARAGAVQGRGTGAVRVRRLAGADQGRVAVAKAVPFATPPSRGGRDPLAPLRG